MADQEQCPECGGKGRKPSPDKLRGPDRDASDISPDLPYEVLDRAIGAARRSVPADVIAPSKLLRPIVEAVSLVLVEHGRQQEREKFHARIEKQRVMAYNAYRECEAQWDAERDVGKPHEKVNEERMQVLDDMCGALWDLLNEPDEEDGEPEDTDVKTVISAEARGAATERDRIRAWVEREEQRLIKIDQSGGYDGDDYEPIDRREGMQIALDRLQAALDQEARP